MLRFASSKMIIMSFMAINCLSLSMDRWRPTKEEYWKFKQFQSDFDKASQSCPRIFTKMKSETYEVDVDEYGYEHEPYTLGHPLRNRDYTETRQREVPIYRPCKYEEVIKYMKSFDQKN